MMDVLQQATPRTRPLDGAVPVRWLRDDRHALALAGMICVLMILMIVPEGFDYGSLSNAASPASGSVLSRTLWLGLLGFGLLVIARRARLAWLLARRLNPFLVLFAALVLASAAWSIDPALTLRRFVRVLTIVVDCVAFVLVSWHRQRYQNVLRPLLTAVLLGSLGFGLLYPTLAIHQESSVELLNAWRGLANHKNSLGALACITLILWFHGWLTREVRLASALAGGMLAVTCLVLSRSATSAAAGAAVVLLLVVLLRWPPRLGAAIPPVVTGALALLGVFSLAILHVIPGLSVLLSPISALTGKDVTFTGRTGIWAIVLDHVRLHPWVGTGYGAYWSGPGPGSPSNEFLRVASFYPGSAHNGYLEILNDLGWVGLICLICYIATCVRHSLRFLVIDRSQGILNLGLIVQQGFTNLSETHWFSVLSVDFAILTLATTALARGFVEHDLRTRFGAPRVRA
jgi:exopolysaccharide production protein ExoQ